MHYLTAVFIEPNADTVSAVASALAPYETRPRAPGWKEYLRPGQILLMARDLDESPADLERLAGRIREWTGWPGGIDDGGLYMLMKCNPHGRWYSYEFGGCWAGRVPDDPIRATFLHDSERLEEWLPHDAVTPDGEWHSRESPRLHGPGEIRTVEDCTRSWLAEFRRTLARHPDSLVVHVDRHT
jgi:hypothetical protein